MRNVWVVAALSVSTALAAYGATVCDSSPSQALDNGSTLTGVGSCSLEGITFSNFVFTATSGFNADPVFSFTVAIDPNLTTLDFHTTNMFNTGEDGVFTFQASPGISAISLTTGPNDIITENICLSPFAPTCPGGDTLNNSPLGSNNGSVASSTVNPAQIDYFFKDDSNGSDFFQTVSSTVPEPMTLSLMGAGLLGLGLFGRRRLRK